MSIDKDKVEDVKTVEEPKADDTGSKEKKADTPALSQEDVNKLVGNARKEGKASGGKALTDLMVELGVENVDDIKTAYATAEAKRKADLSEVEKANEERDTAQADLKAATDAAEQQAQAANIKLMRAEVIAEASKPEHGINPDAVKDIWSLVSAHAPDKIAIDDEGTVTGAAEAITEVLKTREHLKTKHVIGTTRPHQQKLKTEDKSIGAYRERQKKRGRGL